MRKLKIIQLFETYGNLYQPYIPPVIIALKANPDFEVKVNAFKGEANKDVTIIPNYYKRRLSERITSFTNKSSIKLNYIENKYLRNNVDIIHLQHSYLHKKIKGLLSIPKNQRPKVVITLRGADTYMKPWLHNNWSNFFKSYGQHVDAYIAMTNHQKRYVQKWDIDLNKIHVIPISYGNPFDIEERFVNPKTIRLVSAFRMCWEKNIEGNLRVVKYIKEKGFEVNYNIYGDGHDANQVPYLVDKYQLSDCVNYYGSINNEDLKQKLSESDFYLQLSHSESLGMSIIEAQTLGLPAIVSNSDGLPEVVINNKTGYCVKPYDIEEAVNSILKLWESPGKYSTFSKAAILHSQANFSIEKEVDKLSVLYKSLLIK